MGLVILELDFRDFSDGDYYRVFISKIHQGNSFLLYFHVAREYFCILTQAIYFGFFYLVFFIGYYMMRLPTQVRMWHRLYNLHDVIMAQLTPASIPFPFVPKTFLMSLFMEYRTVSTLCRIFIRSTHGLGRIYRIPLITLYSKNLPLIQLL